ncbi:hypothetical protein IKP85_06100 [bacterium]|nr:hypothetical protein [bacterium]
MDVKRVESVAVPTVLATVGAGLAGYMMPSITKNGEISDEFLKYTADSMRSKDNLRIAEADALDKISVEITEEEVAKLSNKNFRKDFIKLVDKKTKIARKTLESFVVKHAEELGVKPKKGQSMKDAARAYIKGKTIEDIKEAYMPSSFRHVIENTDYEQLIKDCFDEAFDKTTKKFKTGEEIAEISKMLKRAATDMRLTVGGVWGIAAGAVALTSAAIANKISKK